MRKYSYENERLAGLAKVVKLSAVLFFATVIALALMLRPIFNVHLALIFLLLIVAGVCFCIVGLGLAREVQAKEAQLTEAERRAEDAESKAKVLGAKEIKE